MTVVMGRPGTAPAASEEPVQPPQVEEAKRWRWTRADYHRASEAGLFGDLRVELLDGEVLVMASQKTPHFASVQLTADLLAEAFGPGHRVRQQAPILLSDDSEPEPDVAVVPGRVRDYLGHHPYPSQVLVLVEVSDATLSTDRGSKRRTYARDGIREYWIVNVNDRQLEVYRDPALLNGGYGFKSKQVLVAGDTVTPLFAPTTAIVVAELFPPTDPEED